MRILLVLLFSLLATPVFACSTDGLFPDAECSPGDIFLECTTDNMCVRGYSATVRSMSKSKKNKVYEMYGISENKRKNYVIDHIISLQLCGSNEIPNLFPQRRAGVINSRTKDKIENYLKRSVCNGDMLLEDAQTVISEDWLSVYEHMKENE